MSPKIKAAFWSFCRVLAAAAGAIYLSLNKGVFELTLDDWKKMANAVVGAAVLTAVNWSRKGETRFGAGSQDIGMGGADKLEPGGQINPDSVPVEKNFGGVGYVEDVPAEGAPVEQTDNRPRDVDPVQEVAQDPDVVYGEPA